MFYGLNKFLKNLLPKRLFYRALLIVAIPVIVIQLIITIVFFDSLWIKTNKGMTRALVNEISTFIEVYDNEEINTHHTNATNPDTDGDSLEDGYEIEIGTKPKPYCEYTKIDRNHKLIHVLLLCYDTEWKNLRFVKKRKNKNDDTIIRWAEDSESKEKLMVDMYKSQEGRYGDPQ